MIDQSMKNIAWLALAALLEALQWMIIAALIGSFIPIPVDSFYGTLFPFMQPGIYKKRDILYYVIFVGMSIVFQAGLLFAYRKFLNEYQVMSKVRAWIVMSGSVLVLQFFIIYQVWLGPNFQLARMVLCAACALAVAARIFWPELYACIRRIIGQKVARFPFPTGKQLKPFGSVIKMLLI